jgi:hypothetical protein
MNGVSSDAGQMMARQSRLAIGSPAPLRNPAAA